MFIKFVRRKMTTVRKKPGTKAALSKETADPVQANKRLKLADYSQAVSAGRKSPSCFKTAYLQLLALAFLKNISRISFEIVKEMLDCKEYKGKTEVECAMEYYKAFYTAPQIRNKFKYVDKPCPAKILKIFPNEPMGTDIDDDFRTKPT